MATTKNKPNYLLFWFIILSGIIHVGIILKICGLLKPRHWIYIPIKFTNTMPKNIKTHLPSPPIPTKLPVPLKASELKPIQEDVLPIKPIKIHKQIPMQEKPLEAPKIEDIEPSINPQAIISEFENAKNKFQQYAAIIRARIESSKHYPAQARRLRIEGTTILKFVISGKGKLINVKIIKSSGKQILDKAALEAVKKAAPFPEAPPPFYYKKEITFTIAINFRLKNFM